MGTRSRTGRGALYIVWGNRADSVLRRSTTSLKNVHPELPIEIGMKENNDGLMCKANMFDLSPFAYS